VSDMWGSGDDLARSDRTADSITLRHYLGAGIVSCYKDVLQANYNPAGTTRGFAGTYPFPLVPTSDFKHRMAERKQH
jgi:hypothetical protein